MKRTIVLVLMSLLFHMISFAQLPPGTVLWSETWEGTESNSLSSGVVDIHDYNHTGTYTINNTPIQYNSYGCYSRMCTCDIVATGIPTGGCRSLFLTFFDPHNRFICPLVTDGLCYYDYNRKGWIIDNYNQKSNISIGFYGDKNRHGPPYYSDRLVYYNDIQNIKLVVGKEFCPNPVISIESDSFTENQTVTINCNDPNARLYYTTDGGDPQCDGIEYDSPFQITSSSTIRAIAVRSGFASSYAKTQCNIVDPFLKVDGIYYKIISLEDSTAAAIGLVDNNIQSLTIPKTINIASRTLKVTTVDFPFDIGKNILHMIVEPDLSFFRFVSCNVQSLEIHCKENATIVIGDCWCSNTNYCNYWNYGIQGTTNNCSEITIIGDNIHVYGGYFFPKLSKLEIIGSSSIGGFVICPKLTKLLLGNQSSYYFDDANVFHNDFLTWYYQSSFIYAPINELRIGNVYSGTTHETNNYYYHSCLMLSKNINRKIIFTETNAVLNGTIASDSINELNLSSNIKRLIGKSSAFVNNLLIENGEPLIIDNYYIDIGFVEPGSFFPKARIVYFDRNASISVLDGLNCEQLTIGEHVISKGTGDATIDVRGDSAFIKIYQMAPPPLGNLFTNNTYVHTPLLVPKGTKTAYSTADNWKNFFSIIEFDWEGLKQTITVINDHPESGTITGAGTYHWGDTVTLVAIPNEGCSFSRWTEDGYTIGTEPTYTFIVNRDRTITASFSSTGIEENRPESIPNVIADKGTITITGADDASIVNVYNIQGQKIYNGSNKTIHISTPGLYVVTIEKKAIKVILE